MDVVNLIAKGETGIEASKHHAFGRNVWWNLPDLNSALNAIDHKFIGTGYRLQTYSCWSINCFINYSPDPKKWI